MKSSHIWDNWDNYNLYYMLIHSYAKINFFLNVENEPANNGYHQLQTFMQKIDLHDIIEITINDNPKIVLNDIKNKCNCSNDKNIITRAALKLQTTLNVDCGAKIKIEKRIPVAAGLAGGSSNAANVLQALIKLWQVDISKNTINKIAVELGADVPFFLWTNAALCEGIGEKITHINPKKYYLVLWNPQLKLSTADVYKQFDAIPREQKKCNRFINAYSSGVAEELAGEIWNNLSFASIELMPKLSFMLKELCDFGACSAFITGSGPTVLGLCNSEVERDEIVQKIKLKYPKDYIIGVQTLINT